MKSVPIFSFRGNKQPESEKYQVGDAIWVMSKDVDPSIKPARATMFSIINKTDDGTYVIKDYTDAVFYCREKSIICKVD